MVYAGMVAHPVTQVIGEQAIVDILDLSKVAWTCRGCTNTSNGLGLRMVKELDLKMYKLLPHPVQGFHS